MNLAPIALFVYNRPKHALQTLEALSKNKELQDSYLYIYADGAKEGASTDDLAKIAETRSVIASQKWCENIKIFHSEKNKGLAASITEGVSQLVEKHGKVIVLEDDIVTSEGFLCFMNEGLDRYEDNEKVMHIGGYLPENKDFSPHLEKAFFSTYMSCWGWATWKRAWDKVILDEKYLYQYLQKNNALYAFNLDGVLDFHKQLEANISGEISTWAIKWYTSIFIENGLCLYPHHSMVQNIGQDGSGVHSGTMYYNPYHIERLLLSEDIPKTLLVEESELGREYLKSFNRKLGEKSFQKYFIKVRNKLLSVFKLR